MNLPTANTVTDILAYGVVFILGVAVKSKLNFSKTNSDALETLTADYRAIKELYNQRSDEVKRKNEQLLEQAKEILELRARIRSYENFLQSRPPEADKVMIQLEPILKAVAQHLDVPFSTEAANAHDAAHSQADKTKA